MQSLARTTLQIARTTRCACRFSSVLGNRPTTLSLHPYSTEALAAAIPEGAPKQYAPKIEQIVQDISQLTLLEVADLNDLLKKTLNISDAPVMAMSAAAPAAAVAEEPEVQQEQALFTVKLTTFDAAKKVALIKEIKNIIAGLNLVQAKKFVESAPQDVKVDLSKEDAEALKKTIEAAGGGAEIV